MQPPTFVQQINTLWGLIGGRVSLNIVAGSSTIEQHGYGDFLDHDERYARAEEFLTVCRAFWSNNGEVAAYNTETAADDATRENQRRAPKNKRDRGANNGEVNFAGKYCQVEKGKIYTPFQSPDRS